MPLRRVADQVRGWRRHSGTKMDMPANPHSEAISTKKKVPPPPPSPERQLRGIGSYSFIAPLGDGKFSKVFLAKHYLTDEQVAIKVIDKRVHDYRVMSRLVREIKLMEALGDHPNIVRLYETFETADSLYLVMEYVPGKNLDEYLQQKGGSLSESEARHIFRQVVTAIKYCHKRWVVHRDLKAPNILLTPDNRVKLADFGLGNRYGLKRLATVCGSMLYYSPEIISHNKYHGPEVDCWCLGILLFRMTAGVEPFSKAGTVGELKKAVVNGDYEIPDHLSDELKMTIKSCLTTKWTCRRSVQRALRGDIWLNDHVKLPDLFLDDVEFDTTDSAIDDTHHERIEREGARRACQKALDDERQNGKRVSKTVVYHPYDPSIYFTSDAEYSRTKEHRESYAGKIDVVRTEMYKDIRQLLQQAQLQPVASLLLSDVKSPVHHLFRRLTGKRPLMESSPKIPRNLSQLYQRMTKDQIHYYSIRHNVSSMVSSPTAVSGYSSLMSTSTIDRAPPSFGYASLDPQHKVDEEDLLGMARSVCKILGVTYRQDSRSQLTCVLTLRNFPDGKRWQDGQSLLSTFPCDAPTTAMQGAKRAKGSSCSSMVRSTSDSLMDSTNSQRSSNWWSKQMKRLSVPINSNQYLHHPSWQPEEEEKSASAGVEGRETPSDDVHGCNDGTVLFTIQAFSVPMAKGKNNDTRIVGVWYSKSKGSSKVFKLATGWIARSLEANYRVVKN